MIKKIVFVAVATAFVAAAVVPLQFSPADAETMTCKEAAKAKYPDDRKTRHEYKKACKDAWKATQA
ncbi:MAG: hypothetical protein ACREDO_03445 [Methyloceanibacter sp.]